MEILLLGIYSIFVWLIFIKFKWLPWTTPWKVGVAIFPILAIAAMLLTLNLVAPTTTDLRVMKYVVPIVSQVKGRVVEVPVENNRPVKKGDVLFRIDPTPYQNEVDSLQAKLHSDEAKVLADQAKLSEVQAKLVGTVQLEPQYKQELKAASDQVTNLTASLTLARTRVEQNSALVKTGAGNRFDLEQAQTNVDQLTAQLAAAQANEQQVREKLSGRVKGELSEVAAVRSQIATMEAQVAASRATAETTRANLETARWNLDQTVTRAPGNGTMVNVMLRPGFMVTGIAFNEVMTFVDNDYQVFAFFGQNELMNVEPGNEAEITLDSYPGHVIKAHVDSILWANAQGQGQASGELPKVAISAPPGKFPVKLIVAEQDRKTFLAAGAAGTAAIYTEHFQLIHLVRRVLIRVSSCFDYIIVKHSIGFHH